MSTKDSFIIINPQIPQIFSDYLKICVNLCNLWIGLLICVNLRNLWIKMTDTSRFKDWKFPEIVDGKPTKYNWVVQHTENFKLGYKTDIGAYTYINAEYGVVIEDLVQIGSHCSVYSVSTIDNKMGQILLKTNCKIGSHSVIMPGVTIGENSVVGAFSFVTQSIPDNVIALGVPAKVIKSIKEDNEN